MKLRAIFLILISIDIDTQWAHTLINIFSLSLPDPAPVRLHPEQTPAVMEKSVDCRNISPMGDLSHMAPSWGGTVNLNKRLRE